MGAKLTKAATYRAAGTESRAAEGRGWRAGGTSGRRAWGQHQGPDPDPRWWEETVSPQSFANRVPGRNLFPLSATKELS